MKYIYMLRAGESQYKVGIASNVLNRLKTIQTSNPNKVEVVTTVLVEDATAVEQEIHSELRDARLDGGKEWFELTPRQAVDLAILINKCPIVDISEHLSLKSIVTEQTKLQKEVSIKLNEILKIATKDAVRRGVTPAPTIALKQKVSKVPDSYYYEEAQKIALASGRISTSLLQRKLSIGYGRAARIIELLESNGYIGPENGSKARVVLDRLKEVSAANTIVA